MSKDKKYKICFAGGGTGGSVTPLLAIADELRARADTATSFDFFWLGTSDGPERAMVENAGITYIAIPAGKFRRYLSWQNLADLPRIVAGLAVSLRLLRAWRPDMVMSAGSFVGVPAVWAAAILKIPVLIHQLDARPGLANKLSASFARTVTVTFENSLADYGEKALWTGNPIRGVYKSVEKRDRLLPSRSMRPVILILGGGTGASSINRLIENSLTELTRQYEIIHVTGANKGNTGGLKWVDRQYEYNYHTFEFIHVDDMKEAYEKADLVISRCGMGTLTELAFFGKPAILIPMPDSHQEDNAAVFAERNAAVVLNQKFLTSEILSNNIEEILGDPLFRQQLRTNIKAVIKPGAEEEIVKIIMDILRS